MSEKQPAPTARLSILLLVVLIHGGLVATWLRVGKHLELQTRNFSAPLILFWLPRAAARAPVSAKPQSPPTPAQRVDSPRKTTRPALVADAAIASAVEPTREPPKIDWGHEAQLAAQTEMAKSELQKSYRDLSASLSPSQLAWLKRNHLEPSTPGVTWRQPRVQVMPNGMSVLHINDHCVLVPIGLLPVVFCSVGHGDANGSLFDHMRDPGPP